MSHDNVNHPSYYKSGKMECIEIIEAFQLDFHLGNAVKYIIRSGKKGDAKEDLNKAIWYLQRAIKNLEDIREYKPIYLDNPLGYVAKGMSSTL